MLDKIKEYAGIITIVISVISSVVSGVIWINDKLQAKNKQLECKLDANIVLSQKQVSAIYLTFENFKQQKIIDDNDNKLSEIANEEFKGVQENMKLAMNQAKQFAMKSIKEAEERINENKDKLKLLSAEMEKINEKIDSKC